MRAIRRTGAAALVACSILGIGLTGESAYATDDASSALQLTNALVAAGDGASALWATYTPEQQQLVSEEVTPTQASEQVTSSGAQPQATPGPYDLPVLPGANPYYFAFYATGCLGVGDYYSYKNVFGNTLFSYYMAAQVCGDGNRHLTCSGVGSGQIYSPFWNYTDGGVNSLGDGQPLCQAVGKGTFSLGPNIPFVGPVLVREATAEVSATTGADPTAGEVAATAVG